MVSGEVIYVEGTYPKFLEYLKGSKAIPVVMPHKYIEDLPYLDGGLRDSAPLKTAIKEGGATEIICILCHGKELAEKWFNPCSILELGERISSIYRNETVYNDIEYTEYCNQFLPDGSPKKDEPIKDYRKIKITTIRPDTEIKLNIQNFTSEDIKSALENGYETANSVLK
jgi:NTE family protein